MLTVKFSDGTLEQGVGWLDLPNKPIWSVTLELNGKMIKWRNYQSYNHLIERVYNVIGQSTTVRGIYLMGQENGLVRIVNYNLITNQVTDSLAPYGQEYNGRPSTGWKNGLEGLTPSYFIE